MKDRGFENNEGRKITQGELMNFLIKFKELDDWLLNMKEPDGTIKYIHYMTTWSMIKSYLEGLGLLRAVKKDV